jgi:hypothetical protein
MIIARMVNFPSTLSDLGYPHGGWDRKYMDNFLATFAARRVVGLKSWTSAYMITGGYSAGGETKEAIIARVITNADAKLRTNRVRQGDTLETIAEKVTSPGIGTFLSGQIVADLKHASWLGNASDWWSWCAVGPGSTAGLNYLHDRDPKKSLPVKQFRAEVQEVQTLLRAAGVHLDAQNTQNCLCELSKYVRTKYYGGKPKTSYQPA